MLISDFILWKCFYFPYQMETALLRQLKHWHLIKPLNDGLWFRNAYIFNNFDMNNVCLNRFKSDRIKLLECSNESHSPPTQAQSRCEMQFAKEYKFSSTFAAFFVVVRFIVLHLKERERERKSEKLFHCYHFPKKWAHWIVLEVFCITQVLCLQQ